VLEGTWHPRVPGRAGRHARSRHGVADQWSAAL